MTRGRQVPYVASCEGKPDGIEPNTLDCPKEIRYIHIAAFQYDIERRGNDSAQCAPEVGRPAQSLRVQRRVVPCRAWLAVEQRVTVGKRRPSGRHMPHGPAEA